ncbi:hypothetical protein Y032_0777g2280 [Ancylostoma ceylanicum]|nr:hypothetical protein Y032_0777g2280 [Ancylostoma ceylanicum]
MAKATHDENSNKELDTRDGERLVYCLAKSCRRQAEDVEKFGEINYEQGKLLVDYRKERERLYECFEKEKQAALNQMKPGKAMGPDDIAVELWKSECWSSAAWLTKFFNRMVMEKNGNEARPFRFGKAWAALLNA